MALVPPSSGCRPYQHIQRSSSFVAVALLAIIDDCASSIQVGADEISINNYEKPILAVCAGGCGGGGPQDQPLRQQLDRLLLPRRASSDQRTLVFMQPFILGAFKISTYAIDLQNKVESVSVRWLRKTCSEFVGLCVRLRNASKHELTESVALPDGRTPVVYYRADSNGYEATYSSYSAPAYQAPSAPVYRVSQPLLPVLPSAYVPPRAPTYGFVAAPSYRTRWTEIHEV
ncbi:hypothetical protein DAPPUDRAFT_239022 [Daphnia pulex]|uniref:Uncharacterized protein n=1 Tax=Daphnia pulex TaxID=6669 RepID=E9G848_DAPPU|nr:hypothetical protein DAPPUDRAFT_239022 [Daphnia pulex]|eukprot:EFX83912.1 hypothetical protein DAPPUDRAFT_239022 [Daphnia pulex]